MIGRFVAWLRGGCSCDPRFYGVAADIDCPKHGLEAALRGRRLA